MPKDTIATQEKEAPEQGQTSVQVNTGGAANQNTLRNVGLILRREYKNRVTQRSFIISTIVLLVLLVIASFIPTVIQYFVSRPNAQTKMIFVNHAGSVGGLEGDTLTQYIQKDLNGSTSTQTSGSSTAGKSHFAISTDTANSTANLQKKVKDGNLDILLVLDRSAGQNLQFTYYSTTDIAGDTNFSQVQALAGQLNFLDKASRLGLTQAQTGSLFVQPAINTVNTKLSHDTRSTGDKVAGFFIAYAGIILIFMSIFLYGMGVAMGVAEEKGSRIMEILVNAATPFQLMVGKIIGIGAAGLTQMVLLVLVGIGSLLIQIPLQNAILGSSTVSGLNINITGTSILLLLIVLLYFILGFLLYSTLFAALGALVRRQDEVQNAVAPITWIFMLGYFASFAGGATPDAPWLRIISYIPFWTPTVMLMRLGAGAVDWWEIPFTIVLMLIAFFICAIISARIYRYGILMYGQKPKFTQLIRLARTK